MVRGQVGVSYNKRWSHTSDLIGGNSRWSKNINVKIK